MSGLGAFALGAAPLAGGVLLGGMQLPPLRTERAPYMKNADIIFLSSGTREVTTINPREFEAARLMPSWYAYRPPRSAGRKRER